MRKCDICNKEYDVQFITTYENVDINDTIQVCEECDHNCESDEETDGYKIEFNGILWRQ